MIPVEQDIIHPPKANCFAACVASILELPLSNVPNFVGEYGERWLPSMIDWLAPMNLSALFLGYGPNLLPPKGYSILSARPPGGAEDHCFVMMNGQLVWDPAPVKKSGIGEPKRWTVFTVINPAIIIPRPTFNRIQL